MFENARMKNILRKYLKISTYLKKNASPKLYAMNETNHGKK